MLVTQKISGQRRTLSILGVGSHDELRMTGLPEAHQPEIARVLPVRGWILRRQSMQQ